MILNNNINYHFLIEKYDKLSFNLFHLRTINQEFNQTFKRKYRGKIIICKFLK